MAVAFAGFASLVSIFGQRDTADDYRAVYWRLRTMLIVSLLVAGLAVFPFVPQAYRIAEPLVWRASSVMLLAGVFMMMVTGNRQFRAMRREGLRYGWTIAIDASADW